MTLSVSKPIFTFDFLENYAFLNKREITKKRRVYVWEISEKSNRKQELTMYCYTLRWKRMNEETN